MKFIFATLAVLTLASCVGNIGPTRLVLSEPNDSASVQTLTHRHELKITENRVLLYNGEEKFEVPIGHSVVFESNGSAEPSFTLLDTEGRHYRFDISF